MSGVGAGATQTDQMQALSGSVEKAPQATDSERPN